MLDGKGEWWAVTRYSVDDISCTRETARLNAKRSSSPETFRVSLQLLLRGQGFSAHQ